jgi:hypothetical protein
LECLPSYVAEILLFKRYLVQCKPVKLLAKNLSFRRYLVRCLVGVLYRKPQCAGAILYNENQSRYLATHNVQRMSRTMGREARLQLKAIYLLITLHFKTLAQCNFSQANTHPLHTRPSHGHPNTSSKISAKSDSTFARVYFLSWRFTKSSLYIGGKSITFKFSTRPRHLRKTHYNTSLLSQKPYISCRQQTPF